MALDCCHHSANSRTQGLIGRNFVKFAFSLFHFHLSTLITSKGVAMILTILFRQFDPFEVACTPYPVTEYQPLYFVISSFEDATRYPIGLCLVPFF
jgi:hypothetical protein